ncbi:hypothetical protein PRIPAC_88177 [Pristionchus pacificus]|uniref:Uncharacterized protein n=1 Tax=Pristionchus pacificus TaxID=54126 RepID=A0A2A6B5R0_PRIPA|nr:hypothetical protein PRIPAC_88177 [Pristionchus pacificus]|eukprot:PDM61193.1 hypothetical protein PRIPAC_50635 [Pristionchus pacificus]
MTQGDIVNVVIIKGDGNITTIINGHRNNVNAIAKGSGHQSAQVAGRRSIKSVHGSYLRAIEPDWKVDTVWRGAAAWENWYIEDWNGKESNSRSDQGTRSTEQVGSISASSLQWVSVERIPRTILACCGSRIGMTMVRGPSSVLMGLG